MTKNELFRFAALAAALAGCAVETPETGVPDVAGEEAVVASESALTSATAGNQTGMVGRWRINGSSICSAVFLPDSIFSGGDSTWVLTNQHCVTDTDPTVYSVVSATGLTANVEKIYWHPIAEWNLGYVGDHGKVDIVLARLASTVDLNAPPMNLSVTRETRDVLQESARRNGTWAFSYDTGEVTPDATYFTRLDVDIPSEDGDSGSPIWRESQVSGAWVLEGIHSSSGSANHASGFYAWLMDALACGAFDTSEPDPDFCTSGCKCGVGEGDCDSDSDCLPGLVCGSNNGALVGLPDDYDVCVESSSRQSSSTSGYCGSIFGCQIYEGDCDTHSDCKGDLICRPNIGYAIGESDTTDVCDLPRMPGTRVFNNDKDTASDHCTVDEPCGLGDGDCDPNNHATCRGSLKCKANVGSHFGFATNSVDVCVHPDFY
ncbi:trypsin-like serine protease [Sorangium sp. So ce854]|uniref:trypsin-like serine protease n=1 Tax=Sorangium sp. So ce854 TaxID=3133322 RepID=UPI003F641FDF